MQYMAAVRAEEFALRNACLRIDVSARKPTLSNMDCTTWSSFARKGSHDMAAVRAEEFALRNPRLRKIGHAADRTGGEPVM